MGNGDEYQRINELVNTNFSMVIPLNFPDAYDVSNPQAADMVSLKKMKHWELAPSNPAVLFDNGIFVAFTSSKLKKKSQFLVSFSEIQSQLFSKFDSLSIFFH